MRGFVILIFMRVIHLASHSMVVRGGIVRLHVLQIEVHISVVAIPHFGHDRDILVVVVDVGKWAIHFQQRFIKEINIFNYTLQKECLSFFLFMVSFVRIRHTYGFSMAGGMIYAGL